MRFANVDFVRSANQANLALGPFRSGARAYLCVQGGIAIEPFLGSASTHVLSGLGGFEGRMLRKGDLLQVGPVDKADSSFHKPSVSAQVLQKLSARKVIRVTDGPQSELFGRETVMRFYESTFRVAEQSNRMGIRLDGPSIGEGGKREMITEGVSLGAIQVTPSGQPIILFVEQQTTGGYPKIANVISADMYCVGQLRPRDEVRFVRVKMAQARTALIEQENLLRSKELIES